MADTNYPRCPRCGEGCETTTLGILQGRDTNRARCRHCGWRGFAWEMSPPPKKERS